MTATVIFLSLHDLGVMFLFGAFVAGMGLLLAEVAWRFECRQIRRGSLDWAEGSVWQRRFRRARRQMTQRD